MTSKKKSMKTVFKLEHADGKPASWSANIIGHAANIENPYVSIISRDGLAPLFILNKDLERFAVNILKALKSKKLKPKEDDRLWYQVKELMISAMDNGLTPEQWVNLMKGMGYQLTKKTV